MFLFFFKVKLHIFTTLKDDRDIWMFCFDWLKVVFTVTPVLRAQSPPTSRDTEE